MGVAFDTLVEAAWQNRLGRMEVQAGTGCWWGIAAYWWHGYCSPFDEWWKILVGGSGEPCLVGCAGSARKEMLW